MSSAFVKEGENEQLKDILPNMASLLLFLKRENGSPVHEIRMRFSSKFNRDLYDMSDGLSYGFNDEGRWQVYLD